MNAAELARSLRAIASRVRRLSPPLSHYPERFHEERSEIAHDLAKMAEALAPAVVERRSRAADPHQVIVTGVRIINGRRVMVQRRRASFAVSVRPTEL